VSTTLSCKDSVKARKNHCCVLCGERINAGEIHATRTGVNPDGLWTMHMHPECVAYEAMPGNVDPDWYEDVSDPAFYRADAIAATRPTNPEAIK
jgi:hypothetical protein